MNSYKDPIEITIDDHTVALRRTFKDQDDNLAKISFVSLTDAKTKYVTKQEF